MKARRSIGVAAVKDAAVDFHQVSTDQPYEDVLGEFLVRRLPKRARR